MSQDVKVLIFIIRRDISFLFCFRLIQLYQQWQHPRIVEINRFYADNEMFDEIFRHVNHIKNSNYPEAVKYYDKH